MWCESVRGIDVVGLLLWRLVEIGLEIRELKWKKNKTPQRRAVYRNFDGLKQREWRLFHCRFRFRLNFIKLRFLLERQIYRRQNANEIVGNLLP